MGAHRRHERRARGLISPQAGQVLIAFATVDAAVLWAAWLLPEAPCWALLRFLAGGCDGAEVALEGASVEALAAPSETKKDVAAALAPAGRSALRAQAPLATT